ncbi:MAG: NAD-binding protein [Solirubrobacterales bacterium]|nr:NAD-binding protein [Solirubrobacterales bacterium]
MARTSKKEQSSTIAGERFRFASIRQDPLVAIIQRVLLAIGLLLVVTMITYIGRDGYVDAQGGDTPLTFIDSLYYATVTITTTGYGDIVPDTQTSRLVTTLVVTPLRVIFLILLVGTTLQVLADKSRIRFRRDRLEKKLRGHVVVCGFGVKGRAALDYMRNHEDDCAAIAIDTSEEALEAATAGITGISGSASDLEVLKAANVDLARTVIVAASTDEQSVLITLRVRELNKTVTVVASCREEQNVELLRRSGADEVIVSSSSAGRILGMAAEAPEAARVVNDLLTFGDGLDINERLILTDNEELLRNGHAETPIAVVRKDRILRPADEDCIPLQKGDLVIYISSTEETITRADVIR